ncbi:MAG TPA: cation transporting ATPase C-terminal domain-containing protein [Leptolyngbyaceae cyanobacterium M65_K2018_010]|nr:cation transporting ATPase C-terminal domain-containing protein [Leptolyngbyaceae cyanobacterium M65_K2018_010]
MGTVFLLAGYYFWRQGWDHWQTMVFSTLAFSRMSLALAMRSERDSLFSPRFFTNPPMLWAVVVTLALQLAVIYLPWLQGVFHTQALSNLELILCLAISTLGLWAVEAQKLFLQMGPHRKQA